ncbi:MAG TPA: hypothetical protein VMY69_03945 [Phycisphaerae bacterium]|nr:hypothetical protein [Phycisphaerae bacterium]
MDKILVTGYPYWAGVAAGLLRRAGFEAAVWRTEPDEVPALLRWNRALRWLFHFLRPSFRAARALHVAGATTSTTLLWLVRRLGKRIILHWVGSDVLQLQRSAAGNGKRLRFCRKVAAAHFADSPELVAELAEMGIRAEVFRLLPETVEPRDVPMPPKPAVLAYWSPGRRTFYRGEIVDALADEFADVMFYVVGSDGAAEPQHPNMTYLGRLESLEEVYGRVSVLLRMPEHDSLSAMVLEMLGRGRWVIYSKPFPHTEMAATLDEAREALRRCLARAGKNEAGQAYVRENFSPQAEAQRIAPIYRRLLTGTG